MSILDWLSARITPILLFALGVALLWGVRLEHLRADHQARADALQDQAVAVVAAIRIATDNPKAGWKTAPAQIQAMGESLNELTDAIDHSNGRIEALATEGKRLRAEGDRLRKLADRALAERQGTIRQLDRLTAAPAESRTCEVALAETEKAFDLLYDGGF